jgi:hypothetical protein
MSQNNQLSNVSNFSCENIIFSKPEIGNIPGQKIGFKRIRLGVKNPDGSIGDFILPTAPKIHTFGLQESVDMGTNKLNGYILPLCLWNRNGPSQEEKQFTDLFDVISDYCKKYLVTHRDEIEKYDLELGDLKKFNPLFWKMDKGKVVENKGPMLYCKVLLNKKNNKITTIFVDEESNKIIDPFKIMNKPSQVTAAIKLESIFIGNKISLQVKLYEVVVKPIDNTIKGLLRPNAREELETKAKTNFGKPVEVNMYNLLNEEDENLIEEEEYMEDDKEDEDDGSIENEYVHSSVIEESVPPIPTPVITEPPKLSEVLPVVQEKKTRGRKTK